MKRLQVLVESEEQEAFRRSAELEGVSLSAWLREAGLRRLGAERGSRAIRSADELDAFFKSCDSREAGHGEEPSWEEHADVISQSRRSGESGT